MSGSDTIYALATAPAVAGVGVIRLSGSKALSTAMDLGVTKTITPRYATYTRWYDEDKNKIDEGLTLYFPAPHSFTGEDVVELHIHSSKAVIAHMYKTLSAIPGLRLAEQGEFSKRAFLNQKMDLAQLEALADLLDADTLKQKEQALANLSGEQSVWFDIQRQKIINILAYLEAFIDFPDEDIPETAVATIQKNLEELNQAIARHLNNSSAIKLKEGLSVVIYGPPNAGKSSLLNSLANKQAAIISPIAGTTRDVIEVPLELQGYAVTLIDTAGLHDASQDIIEKEGIKRAREKIAKAEIALLIIPATDLKNEIRDTAEFERKLISLYRDYAEVSQLTDVLIILSKKDELDEANLTDMENKIDRFSSLPFEVLSCSIHQPSSLKHLTERLMVKILYRSASLEGGLPTRERHQIILQETLTHLNRFGKAIDEHLPLELAAEDLRLSARSLARINGHIEVETVLDAIFSKFCIGK